LRAAMTGPAIILGLLADQSTSGWRGPFLGHDCSTTTAPAIFALRYHCEFFSGFCFRVGLAKWRIELGDAIPIYENGQPRSVDAITADMNRSFETAVRRDPANWFWVHKRWKPESKKEAGRRLRREHRETEVSE